MGEKTEFTPRAYRWQTAFQWCLETNIRPLNLLETDEDFFMNTVLHDDEFLSYIAKFDVKPNSMPRKPEKYLELRMYGFVPYNLSGIQKGIQFGHAVVEYGMKNMNTVEYQEFANRWKTFIILSGGTSNEGQVVKHGYSEFEYLGSMQRLREELFENDIIFADFYEPDLNSMLSAFVFLVDERVFNKDLYPDFKSHPYPWLEKNRKAKPTPKQMDEWVATNDKNYASWVEKIGGPKNAFLREFLRDKKLA